MQIYMEPGPDNQGGVGGIAQICTALHRYLPDYGMHFQDTPDGADLIVMHVGYVKVQVEHFDVLHLHGFHYTAEPGKWGAYDYAVSASLAANLRRRLYGITVPSEWCAQLLRRDMRMQPTILPSGINTDEWASGKNQGHLLWNKYRINAICDPTPAYELAQRGIPVLSTFAPRHKDVPPQMQLTGKLPAPQMHTLIENADIYLATTLESQGISTIEAMASGVPILGYNHGGTAGLVQHQVTGWLVEPGDIDGLEEGYYWLRANRSRLSAQCREAAQVHDWQVIIPQFVEFYQNAYDRKRTDPRGVACVVTCYNYAQYLPACLDSILSQTYVPDEIVLVDDGSTDETPDIARRYQGHIRLIRFNDNQGIARAVNAGIAATTQPYVFHAAADDTLEPHYVEMLHTALRDDPTLGIAYSNVRAMHEDGTPQSIIWPDADFDFEIFAHQRNLIPGVAMHRREMWERIGGYHDTIASGNSRACDYHFWLRGVAAGFAPRLVSQEPLYNYRQHHNSMRHSHKEPDIRQWLPWTRDKHYPFAAPATKQPLVRSYHRCRVTIVVPVGPGHERHVPTALESILGQAYRDWHVILVDDTTDGIPRRILNPYPFVQVIRTNGGEGAGKARNAGLQLVTSELVIWLDADDYLMPSALSKMIAAYDEHHRYVYSHSVFVEPDRLYVKAASTYSQQAMLYETRHLVTALMRTEDAQRVGGFDTTMPSMEVRDFYARLAVAGICGVLVPEPLVGYRLNEGMRRQYLDEHKNELVEYFDGIYGDYKEGTKQMACCGGNPSKSEPTNRSPGPKTIRMCYTGTRKGATWYYGLNGRQYQFGASVSHQCKDVHPDDVAVLLQKSGHLEIIQRAESVAALQQSIAPPLPVVVEEPEERPNEADASQPKIEEQQASVSSPWQVDKSEEQPVFLPIRPKRGRPRKHVASD